MKSYNYSSASKSIIFKTIGQMLNEISDMYPDNECLISIPEGIRYNYKQFREEVNKLAKAFLALGIKKGDRVAIWSTNNAEWVLAQFATAKIGAILVTINPAYRASELEYALKQSETSTLILIEEFKSSDYISILYSVAPFIKGSKQGELNSIRFPYLKNVICISQTKYSGMFRWDDVLEMHKKIDNSMLLESENSLDPDDIINIQYTSGTTGFPKAACLTHVNILNNGYFVGEAMKFTEKDRLCVPVPFYHCFGMVMSNLTCISHGSCVVIPSPYFDPIATLTAVEKEKCTALHGVPTMFIAELEHPEFSRFDLSSLRTGIMAGSPCPIEVMKRVNNQMHMSEVTIAYGQTESSPVITQTTPSDSLNHRVETVGKPLPFIEVKIIDPQNGQTVEANQQGELCARGYSIMRGYYNNTEATKSAIDQSNWLHTGDLAVMTEDGYFKITGRIKDMIIRGGENIYPREIEEFLYTHTGIVDAQVIGVPDPKYGEEICAWIKLRDGYALTEEEVKEFCREKIARYKVPRYIKFVDTFPATITGKIRKVEMREISIKELNLEAASNIETA